VNDVHDGRASSTGPSMCIGSDSAATYNERHVSSRLSDHTKGDSPPVLPAA
jgi:hypothetical protein